MWRFMLWQVPLSCVLAVNSWFVGRPGTNPAIQAFVAANFRFARSRPQSAVSAKWRLLKSEAEGIGKLLDRYNFEA